MGRRRKVEIEEEQEPRTFSILTGKPWFTDGKKIKVGESMSEIMNGKIMILNVREILEGDIFKTWKIVITTDDNIYLLKTSKELK